MGEKLKKLFRKFLKNNSNMAYNMDLNSILLPEQDEVSLSDLNLSNDELKEFIHSHPNLKKLYFNNCNIESQDFLYELNDTIEYVDLSRCEIKNLNAEEIINFRRDKLPCLKLPQYSTELEEYFEEKNIVFSDFLHGIKDSFAFEWEYKNRDFGKINRMTVNDMHNLEIFIDFERDELKEIERTIFIDENQEFTEEYIGKINSLPFNEKSKIALTVEQAKKLKGKIDKDISVRIYGETVKDVSVEDIESLENYYKIAEVQITDDVKKSELARQYCDEPYTVQDYKSCRSAIDYLIEDIDVKQYEGNPNRDKILFGIVMKRLAHILSYDQALSDGLNDERKVTSRNMVGGLLNGIAVCAGFAEITKQVLSCLDIEATYVWGAATRKNGLDDAGHAWNQVKLDGEWYNLDFTNARNQIELGLIPNFFLKKDEDFRWYETYKIIQNKKHECKQNLPITEVVDCLYGTSNKVLMESALACLPNEELINVIMNYSFTHKKYLVDGKLNTENVITKIQDSELSKKIVAEITKSFSTSEISESARILKETKKEQENSRDNIKPEIDE